MHNSTRFVYSCIQNSEFRPHLVTSIPSKAFLLRAGPLQPAALRVDIFLQATNRDRAALRWCPAAAVPQRLIGRFLWRKLKEVRAVQKGSSSPKKKVPRVRAGVLAARGVGNAWFVFGPLPGVGRQETGQTLEGSFSAVSKPIFASNY